MEQDDQRGNQRPVYRDANLQIIFGVTLMAVLGVSSITPAFPRIAEELQISPQAVGSLVTAFTLPGAVLTAVLGVLADQFGRKRILVPALMLFGIAGTACALTRDFNLLLLLRLFQGLGAAGLGSINVTIIGDLYRGRERIVAMGCNSSVLSVGTASYPAIGGALATLGWNYPFALPLAAIPVGLAVLFSLENPEPKNIQSFRAYLSDAWRIVARRQVVGFFVVSVITFIIMYGSYLTYFSLFIEEMFDVSPFVIGLIMSSASLGTALTSSQVGRMATRYTERSLIRVACVLYAVALVAVPSVPELWLLLIPSTIFGIAQGLNMPSLLALLAGLAPMRQRGALMSVNGMVLRMGQTLGPLIMGTVIMFSGTAGVFYAGAAFAMLMFVLVILMIR